MNGPSASSAASIVRSPDVERTVSLAPSAIVTAGMSAAGSACASPPPIVPRLRT